MSVFLKLWWVTLAVKLLIGACLPLFSDEAYYWFWSHHMQLSFFDHPPFVAWLYWLGQSFEFMGHAVRWPGIILGHASLLIWFKILKPYLELKRLHFFLIFYLMNPLIGWGSLAVLPDTPLLFFWPLAIYFLLQLLETKNWRYGFALGLALGLGFLSKYHMAVFVPIALVWITWTKRWRQVPLMALPAALVAGLLASAPALIWNYQNDYVSFQYQFNHGLGVTEYKPLWAIQFILTHVGLLFPTTIWAIARAKWNPRLDWLYYFGLGPLLFFFLSAFKGRPEANWPSVAYPVLFALALIVSPTLKWAKQTLLLWTALFVLVGAQIVHPWIPLSPSLLKTNELTEYDVIIPYVTSHAPLYASSLQMASALSYQLKRPIYKLQGIGRRDFFDFLKESNPNSDLFYVVMRDWDALPAWANSYSIIGRVQINPTFHILGLKKF